MTRPVRPASGMDVVARQGKGIESLAKRPAPVAEGGSMWGIPDLILSGGFTNAPSNTEMPVPFIDYATRHTSGGPTPPFDIEDADGALFTLDVTDDGDAGNDRYRVTSKREGFWAGELITQWANTTSGGTEEFGYALQAITWESLAGIAFSPTTFRNSADWMDSDVHPFFGWVEDSYLRTWMPPHYLPANKAWKFVAKQRTGVDRDLSGISAKFWFIAADDLSAWTFDSV